MKPLPFLSGILAGALSLGPAAAQESSFLLHEISFVPSYSAGGLFAPASPMDRFHILIDAPTQEDHWYRDCVNRCDQGDCSEGSGPTNREHIEYSERCEEAQNMCFQSCQSLYPNATTWAPEDYEY